MEDKTMEDKTMTDYEIEDCWALGSEDIFLKEVLGTLTSAERKMEKRDKKMERSRRKKGALGERWADKNPGIVWHDVEYVDRSSRKEMTDEEMTDEENDEWHTLAGFLDFLDSLGTDTPPYREDLRDEVLAKSFAVFMNLSV